MYLAQFVLCMFCSVPLIHQTEKANHETATATKNPINISKSRYPLQQVS